MSTRQLKYWEALAEATLFAMEDDPNVFLMGEGIDDPKGVFGTTLPALKKFGPERVFDSPLSESAVTGIGIGAALEGNPCVMIHMRMEFLLLGIDQIINHAAKWHYMNAGTMNVPIVVRCIIGRGWGQAAQHSQSFHSFFSHIPGLKVILPSNAYDAKGLLYSAIKDPNPVICIEHRWLYDKVAEVPEGRYEIPLGKANVVAEGSDVTCVATSFQVHEAIAAREILAKDGISMEIIDLRSTLPLDFDTIHRSLEKTGHLIVTDIGHKSFGIGAEVAALAAERAFDCLVAPVERIANPDSPTPCAQSLEQLYYPKVQDLVAAAHRTKNPAASRVLEGKTSTAHHPNFFGPF